MTDTITTAKLAGFDVWWESPMGNGGWIFKSTDTADEARAQVAEMFAADNFPVTIREAISTRHTADRTTFLVVGPGVWGHADTVAEAKRNYKRQGGKLTPNYVVVEFPVGVSFRGVTGMGGYRWEVIGPRDGLVITETLYKGGKPVGVNRIEGDLL